MALCPKDLKPCIDDLCYGGGCLRMQGVSMVEHCSGCGQIVSIDGEDSDCECEPSNWEAYWREDDYGIGVPDRPGILPKD